MRTPSKCKDRWSGSLRTKDVMQTSMTWPSTPCHQVAKQLASGDFPSSSFRALTEE